MEAKTCLLGVEPGVWQSFENMAVFPLRFSGNGGPGYITLGEARAERRSTKQRHVNSWARRPSAGSPATSRSGDDSQNMTALFVHVQDR